MSRLTGKTALLIGGLADRVAENLEHAGATALTLSETDLDTLLPHLAAQDPLDIAIISPNWLDSGAFMETTPALWRDALRSNYEFGLLTMQAAARNMIARRVRGRIVLFSSVAALRPLANLSVLGTTLAALHVAARMAAVDLGPYGITVNVIALGWTSDGWMPDALRNTDSEYIEANIPLGTVGAMRDVGELCSFLASPQAGHITGAIIPVDGGYLLTKAGAGTPRMD